MPMHSFKPGSQNNAPPIVPMRPIPPAPHPRGHRLWTRSPTGAPMMRE